DDDGRYQDRRSDEPFTLLTFVMAAVDNGILGRSCMSIPRRTRTVVHNAIEAIATTFQRLDVRPTVRHGTEGLSQNVQILGKIRFLYDGVRPDDLHQLILADHLPASTDKHA